MFFVCLLIVCRQHNDEEWKFNEQRAKMRESIAAAATRTSRPRGFNIAGASAPVAPAVPTPPDDIQRAVGVGQPDGGELDGRRRSERADEALAERHDDRRRPEHEVRHAGERQQLQRSTAAERAGPARTRHRVGRDGGSLAVDSP